MPSTRSQSSAAKRSRSRSPGKARSRSKSPAPRKHGKSPAPSTKKKKPTSSALSLAVVPTWGLVAGWYGSAVCAVITSKKVVTMQKAPFVLTAGQFLTAAVVTFFAAKVVGRGSITPLTPSSLRNSVTANSCCYTMGFLLTNLAFSLVGSHFAETVKASEPLTSVALSLAFYSEGASPLAYASLLPIVGGVAMSAFGELGGNILKGSLCAMGSNFCFSGRSVFTKRIQSEHKGKLDAISLFHWVSLIGFVCLCIPAALVMEFTQVKHLATGGGSTALFTTMALNGVCYASYNLLSFMVLERVPLMTHAVLNVTRRLVIIVCSVYYFDEKLTTLNMAGIATAVGGVGLFTYAKKLAAAEKGPRKK